jgi:DNA-directed RNA polymerase specialized sigma24 family protein
LARDPDLLHDLCSSVERLAKTDPAASELLGLSLVMGFSNGEIAEVLGISERHSRRQLAAALRELRRLLEDAA